MNVNKAVLKFVKMGLSLILTLLVVYITVGVSLTGFDFGYRVFTEPAMEADPGREVVVIVEKSMGAKELGEELYQKGLIRDANLFVIQLKLSAYEDDITPGTYILSTSMTPKEMMVEMAKGPLDDGDTEAETDTKK